MEAADCSGGEEFQPHLVLTVSGARRAFTPKEELKGCISFKAGFKNALFLVSIGQEKCCSRFTLKMKFTEGMWRLRVSLHFRQETDYFAAYEATDQFCVV